MSFYDDDMSEVDKSILNVDFAEIHGEQRAPAFMTYPTAGSIQLAHAFLYEQHHGAGRSAEHKHAVYHLVIFEEADNIFLLNGVKERSTRGTCVCCPPGVPHSFLPRRKGMTVYHALTFAFETMIEPPSWSAVIHHYTGRFVKEIPLIHMIPEVKLLNMTSVLAGLRKATTPRGLATHPQFYYAVLQWLAYIADLFDERRPQGETSERRSTAVQARACLDANYAGVTHLGEVARQVGVTPAHLNRAFSREYGITPGRYREALRMKAAENLLRRSDLLMKEIASRLGYPDHFTFSKAFRRHHHCPPSAFKREADALSFPAHQK